MSELGRLLHIEGEPTYRTNEAGQPIDDWGEVIPPDDPIDLDSNEARCTPEHWRLYRRAEAGWGG